MKLSVSNMLQVTGQDRKSSSPRTLKGGRGKLTTAVTIRGNFRERANHEKEVSKLPSTLSARAPKPHRGDFGFTKLLRVMQIPSHISVLALCLSARPTEAGTGTCARNEHLTGGDGRIYGVHQKDLYKAHVSHDRERFPPKDSQILVSGEIIEVISCSLKFQPPKDNQLSRLVGENRKAFNDKWRNLWCQKYNPSAPTDPWSRDLKYNVLDKALDESKVGKNKYWFLLKSDVPRLYIIRECEARMEEDLAKILKILNKRSWETLWESPTDPNWLKKKRARAADVERKYKNAIKSHKATASKCTRERGSKRSEREPTRRPQDEKKVHKGSQRSKRPVIPIKNTKDLKLTLPDGSSFISKPYRIGSWRFDDVKPRNERYWVLSPNRCGTRFKLSLKISGKALSQETVFYEIPSVANGNGGYKLEFGDPTEAAAFISETPKVSYEHQKRKSASGTHRPKRNVRQSRGRRRSEPTNAPARCGAPSPCPSAAAAGSIHSRSRSASPAPAARATSKKDTNTVDLTLEFECGGSEVIMLKQRGDYVWRYMSDKITYVLKQCHHDDTFTFSSRAFRTKDKILARTTGGHLQGERPSGIMLANFKHETANGTKVVTSVKFQ